MFNVGRLIKDLSVFLGVLLLIGFLFVGAYLYKNVPNFDDIKIFVICFGIGGLFSAFLTTLILYGFGALIDTNNQILNILKSDAKK